MQEAAARAAALPEPDIRPGTRLQHVGEVLAAHRRVDVGNDVASAEDALAYAGGEFGLALAVDGRRIAAGVLNRRRTAERLGHLADDLADAPLGEIPRLRLEAAHGADQLHRLRDDVEGADLARGHRAD